MAGTFSASHARSILPQLKKIAEENPDVWEANFSYSQALESGRLREGTFDRWLDMHRRFPHCRKSARLIVRWYQREHKAEEARRFIENLFPGLPETLDDCLEKADMYCELRDLNTFRQVIAQTKERFPNDLRARLLLIRRLVDFGFGFEALRLIESIPEGAPIPRSAAENLADLRRALNTLLDLAPKDLVRREDTSCLALALAIEQYIGLRRHAPCNKALGPTALITGSLGAGGAERQLARTGMRLTIAQREGVKLGGVEIEGPVDIVVKSLLPAEGHDFFLGPVRREQVRTFEIDDMRPVDFSELKIDAPHVANLLPLLPSTAVYGVKRMVSYFTENRTQAAYIWQDGAVLFAALAALIAGVPRIQLSMRGLPPSMREHLFHPAYPLMYKALAKVPGVYFTSNSRAAADAYCEWIGMEKSRFTVVYNGVLVVEKEPAETDIARWQRFEKKTGGPEVPTIGSVFRFDTDKRPALWIDFAQAYLKRFPGHRILLVGGGRMLPAAREKAAELGIADRILFVGQSSDVGFWLKKMSAFILLSRFEGLPNAIIEAQLCGVPIVSTPAGGAAEAFVEGVTGRVLSSVDPVDLDECCDKVEEILGWQHREPETAARIQTNAQERFSTEAMVARTARLLSGQLSIEENPA